MDQTEEIADLKRRLTESETRYRLLIGGWAQAVWETDAQGVVVADSPSWRAYTGQTVDEWLGYGWLDAIHPGDRDFAERQWRKAMAARRAVDAEFRLCAPDGGWRWTNVRAVPLLNAQGDIEKWAGLNIDIDARKSAEMALRESEERQAFLLALSDALRPLADAGDITSVATRLLAERLGVSRCYYAEWPAGADHGLIARDYAAPGMASLAGRYPIETFRSAYDRVAQGDTWVVEDNATAEGIGEAERRYHQTSGVIAWVDVPLVKEGRPVAVLCLVDAKPRRWTAQEIELVEEVAERMWTAVERAHAEAALRRSERRLRALFESIDEGYSEMQVVLDEEGQVVDWRHLALNGKFSRVTGIPDITGRLASEVFPNLEGEWFDRMDLAYRTGEPQRFETELAELGRWFDNYITRMGGEDDDRMLGVFGDITERKLAERALRESEGRFIQFADASAAALWIRNADTLSMEFASCAIAAIYGIQPDAILGDEKRWAALIVPDDRALALEHIERARQGEAVVYEFRIKRPSDGAFRWLRNTDFPLYDARNRVQRIGGITEDVTEAKLATEHQAVLLAELQHRVRNIMALVLSITARTGERAQNVTEYRELMLGRLLAFTRVQALLTRAGNASVGIASIVRDEVSVQAQREEQYVLDGPNVELSPKAAEVLTLAVHELATNAVKYGALSVPTGQVRVRWSTFEKRGGTWLSFDWTEAGAPERPEPTPHTRRRGFGSELIEGRVPYELKGQGTIEIQPGGARCHMEFPLTGGASILETGAPRRATVFGGILDMTGEPDLTGLRVLVVEDDYYLATDTARALQGVGAVVLGPSSTEQDARVELSEQRPDAVVLDINLGTGASFKLAEHLKDNGIPFVFVTGYDQGVIPTEFEGVVRLEKPLQLRQVVGSVSKLPRPAE